MLRRVAGAAVVILALLWLVGSAAGSAGQPQAADAAAGAVAVAGPVIVLGVWLILGRGGRRGPSARPRWHTPAALLVGAVGLSAAPLAWTGGQLALGSALVATPVAAALWWVTSHYTDAPPRPTLVTLPGGHAEPALLYVIPRSKQLALAAVPTAGLAATVPLAVAARAAGHPVWWLLAGGALWCARGVWRTVAGVDPEAGLALSTSGVSVREHGDVLLVPWPGLRGAEMLRAGRRGPSLRRLGLEVDDVRAVQGLRAPARALATLSRAAARHELAWATWRFDTDAERIADHVEVMLDEPELRPGADLRAMSLGADRAR